jgi:hypothetical protein
VTRPGAGAKRGDFVMYDKLLRSTRPGFLLPTEEDRNMKAQHLVAIALAAMASAVSVAAHEIDPGGTIKVACADDGVRMAAISSAVEISHYWAPQSARRHMLSLARQACARGATFVTFVPPADQRVCQAPPTWSTLCLDQTATARERPDNPGQFVP